MDDQAAHLRRKIENRNKQKQAKTICILSGKGGVGKSNVAVNFGLDLINHGKKVLIIDLDIGMGNIDILLGLTSRHTIYDMFHDYDSIFHIIEKGENGLDYIAGGSGLNDFLLLNDEKKDYFIEQFSHLVSEYDYIIFDMGAGIDRDSLFFILAADELIVITTPEPTSITDAYSVIKQLVNHQAKMPIQVIMNRCISQKTGEQTLERFKQIINRFLHVDIIKLGVLPEDKAVNNAVMNQLPYILNEKAQVTKSLKQITLNYIQSNTGVHPEKPKFLQRLKQFLIVR